MSEGGFVIITSAFLWFYVWTGKEDMRVWREFRRGRKQIRNDIATQEFLDYW